MKRYNWIGRVENRQNTKYKAFNWVIVRVLCSKLNISHEYFIVRK